MTEKEKYLASAQKHVLKGSYDRAIKDYEQLVALDPQDLRHRQRLAELLARVQRKDEAIREYDTIGKFYADNAYHLKAIAVYKQIQKINPTDITVALTLASLNEKQGLKGNALAEYQSVLRHLESSRDFGETIRVMEKMLLLDPDNVDLHLRLAETCLSANFRDRAYQAFLRTALVCSQLHNDAGFGRVCDRIREIFPEQQHFIIDLAQEQVRGGQADEAIIFLQALLEQDDSNMAVWHLLADAYNATGDWENVKDTYSRMTVLFPNDLTARDKLVSCCIIEENVEEALTILDSCLSFFPAGELSPLERPFLKLIQMAPTSLRPLLGLRDLYEKTGALDKLTEVELKLEILRKHRPEDVTEPVPPPSTEEPEDTVPADAGTEEKAPEPPREMAVEETGYGEILLSSVEAEPAPAQGLSWEEIDLTLDDELLLHAEAVRTDGEGAAESAGAPHQDPSAFGDLDLDQTAASAPSTDQPWGDREFSPEPEPVSSELEPESPAATELRTLPDGAEEGVPQPPTTEPGDAAPAFEEDDILPDLVDAPVMDTIPPFPDLPLSDEMAPEQSPEPLSSTFSLDELPDFLTEEGNNSGLTELFDLPGEDLPDSLSSPDSITEIPLPGSLGQESSPPSQRTPTYGVDDQGTTFRKGLDSQVDREDTETHYNLGIAFKEMGLLSSAIEEFRISARDPKRRVDSLLLQGICLRENGNRQRAYDILYAALEEGGATPVEEASIRYELALMAQEDGDLDECCRFFQEIMSEVPGFRDVAERMTTLGCEGGVDEADPLLEPDEVDEA